MRLIVLGAGATGGVFGARLAAAGVSVLLVGRRPQVEAIREHGLRVDGVAAGRFRLEAATELPRGTPADAVLLTVKSFDLAVACTELATRLPPTPTAVMGNGLGLEEVASGSLLRAGWARPAEVLVRAVHTVPVTALAAGHLRASGTGEVVLPSARAAGPAAEAADRFHRLFVDAGYPVRLSDDMNREVWRKAVVNAAVNPVTALRRVPNGALRDGPLRLEAERLLDEAVRVATGSGVELSRAPAMEDFDRVVAATAENRSSMLQDVERGRPTEIDAISGEILRRGARLGFALPATAAVVEALTALTPGRSPKS